MWRKHLNSSCHPWNTRSTKDTSWPDRFAHPTMFCIQGACENHSFPTCFSGILHIWPISSVWFTAFVCYETNLTLTHVLFKPSPSAGHPQCCNLAVRREDKSYAFQELKVHSSTGQPTDKSWDCLVECKDLNFPRHQHHLPEKKLVWFKQKFIKTWWGLQIWMINTLLVTMEGIFYRNQRVLCSWL